MIPATTPAALIPLSNAATPTALAPPSYILKYVGVDGVLLTKVGRPRGYLLPKRDSRLDRKVTKYQYQTQY